MKSKVFFYYFVIFLLNTYPGNILADVQTIETIDSSGDVGLHTSIALDSSGNPHISYFDKTDGHLNCACWSGLTWAIETVDISTHVTGEYSSIAVDSEDRIHISYYDRTGTMPTDDIVVMPDLKYAYQTSTGAWLTETIRYYENAGKFSSIAVREDNIPIIIYYEHLDWKRIGSSSLRIAHVIPDTLVWVVISGYEYPRWFFFKIQEASPPAEWSLEDYYEGRFCSTAIDENEIIHIAYYTFDLSDTNYLWYECGSSSPSYFYAGDPPQIQEVVDSGTSHDVYVSLALDSNGIPHISYYDSATTDLKYAYRAPSSGEWVKETADSRGDVGKYNSIAIGNDGTVRIGYYDNYLYSLKYALRSAAGEWNTYKIDTGGVGKYASMILDDDNIPHISYYDETNSDLKYCRLTQLPEPDPKSESTQVSVYPNPFRFSENHNEITFDELPAGAKISIFTLSGNLVIEITDDNNGIIQWGVKNQSNQRIARGLYYVVVTKNGTKISSGKFLIAK